MKHTDFSTVQRYVQEIEAINLDLVHVTGGGSGLGVTIQGRYQDDTIVNQVRPVVVGILQRAKAKRILALRELGVDIPDEPVAITNAERYEWLKKNATQTPDEYGQAEQLYFGTYAAGDLDGALDDAIRETREAEARQMPLLDDET